MNPIMSRRHAIKLVSGTGIAVYLSQFQGKPAWAATPGSKISEISPIDRSLGEVAPQMWFSDYPDRAHKVLWDKAGYVSSLGAKTPVPTEKVPLVIIGGGMSGLFSAYLLKKHKPVILEQAPRFGGNSKGQSWRGIDYSMAAAYFIEPEPESDLLALLTELGVDKMWKVKTGEDPVALGGKIFNEFWSGECAGEDETAKAQFAKLREYFTKVNEGEEIPYPDIPVTDPETLDYIKELDTQNFKAHLEKIAGGPLVGPIETAIEHYCWSSLGASASAVSAAAGLNFYASEFSNLVVTPGGNAAVAERLLERLDSALPKGNLRADALVYDVKVVEDGVVVSYQDGGGNAKAIHAKAVIMACPKFVAGKVLTEIEPERVAAIKKLQYGSYLVANACIKGGGAAPFYDLYLLGEGNINVSDLRAASEKQQITDVIYANYAKAVGANTVLTLYRGLPYAGVRGELLAPDSYKKYRAQFEQQLKEVIFPLLKIAPENLVDIRIARWGHPIPTATPGLIADGTVDMLRKPFKDKVFFVEQDNWALPAFETAVAEAQIWAPEVDKVLSK